MDLKKSVVLSRTFFLIILAIIFSAGLMIVLSTFMTNHFRNKEIVEDLTAKTKVIAKETAKFESGALTGDSFYHFLYAAPDMMQAGIAIDMNKDVTWANTRIPIKSNWSKEDLALVSQHITTFVSSIENRENVIFTTPLTDPEDQVIFVGVPVISEDNQSQVLGAIYLFKSMEDYNTGATPIILSFLAAFLLTLSLMAFPAYYFINLMVKPLLQIRDVAKGISGGYLSRRVEQHYPAEFGELSISINHMADNLQQTISDLETESNRLQQVLNGLNEGIIAYTSKLELSHINPTFCNYFPDCQQLTAGSNISEMANDAIRNAILNAIKTTEVQYLDIPTDDRHFFGQFLILKNSENIFQGVVGLFRDITEEARLEQTRRDYVSNVSHELKTPLTAMRCMVEPLLDGLITEKDQINRYYHIIYEEILRMSRLIDDILELSRLQSGRTTIELIPFQIKALLENLSYKFSTIAREANINFTLEMPSIALPLVYANPDRVEQIIYIYLDNARKFTPQDGEIILRVSIHKDYLQLAVQDTGKGIPLNEQQHIFDRFYKVDKSHGSIGTGLGLSIVKEITEQTNEKIGVISEPDNGATFFINLALYNNQDILANEEESLI